MKQKDLCRPEEKKKGAGQCLRTNSCYLQGYRCANLVSTQVKDTGRWVWWYISVNPSPWEAKADLTASLGPTCINQQFSKILSQREGWEPLVVVQYEGSEFEP